MNSTRAAAVETGSSPVWTTLLQTLPFVSAFSVFPLAIAAAVNGGWYVLLPFWSVIAALDFLVGENSHNPDTHPPPHSLFISELLTYLWLPTQACLYIVVFYNFFYADHLALWEKLFVLFATGRATSLGLSVGHELSHSRSKWGKILSECMMSFAGLGHYSTEHLYVHHTNVATPRDPVTARKGESLYGFIVRSWSGSIAKSWSVERERLSRRGRSVWHRSNPWWRYASVLFGIAAASYAAAEFGPHSAGGWQGVWTYLGIVLLANVNLRGIDYIEHYGLTRIVTPRGRFEHTKPRHSWNSTKRISSYIMFNVQRHSDHHYKPARAYPLLQTYDESEAAQMPSNYIAMYCIALFPPLWRRIMHPRLAAWRQRFYPEISDWSAYDSPLFYRKPEKYPLIAEVMENDKRLSDWMHRHPDVLNGKHAPEEAHLTMSGMDIGDELGGADFLQRGLVSVFYSKELSSEEIAVQLSDLTQAAESVEDFADSVRPWLEDRSFQLGLHLIRGNIDQDLAKTALTRIIEGAVLHVAHGIDREFDAEFDEPSISDAPKIFALGSLGRSEIALGDELSISVQSGPSEGNLRSGDKLARFQNSWSKQFLRGLERLFFDDFPCRLMAGSGSGDSFVSGGWQEGSAARQLRPGPG